MSGFQLTMDNKVINISINIADLLTHGSINISLNQASISPSEIAQIMPIQVAVAEAEVIDDTSNVTFRKVKKQKQKTQLIIEEDEPLIIEKCEDVKEKPKKYISHKYERDADGLIQCPYCDCKKKNLSTISMHVSVNHASEMGRESNPFKCEHPGCNKRFPIKTRLQHHVNNHHVIENLDCPFPGCKYSDAKNKQTLYTHYVRKHMNYETMCNGNVCNTCNSTKPTGIIYHLATCNSNSPFCKSIV